MESRSFCVTVQLAQRRTIEEVKALMAPPETVQAALERVVRQVNSTHLPHSLCVCPGHLHCSYAPWCEMRRAEKRWPLAYKPFPGYERHKCREQYPA